MTFTLPGYEARKDAAAAQYLRTLCVHEAGHAVLALQRGSKVGSISVSLHDGGTTMTERHRDPLSEAAITIGGIEAVRILTGRGGTGDEDRRHFAEVTQGRPDLQTKATQLASGVLKRSSNWELVSLLATNLLRQLALCEAAKAPAEAVLSGEAISTLAGNRRLDAANGLNVIAAAERRYVEASQAAWEAKARKGGKR